MDILAFDLSQNGTGWARGPAGSKPASGSFVLPKGGAGPGTLAVWIRDHRREFGKPDFIGVEKWMEVGYQRSNRSIETSLRLDGSVHAMAGVYGIPVAEINVSKARKTVCGRGNASSDVPPGIPKHKLKDAQRAATKAMVVRTMILLGLLPTGCEDDNRADALVIWRYVEAVYGRRAPAEFVLLP